MNATTFLFAVVAGIVGTLMGLRLSRVVRRLRRERRAMTRPGDEADTGQR